MQAAFSRGIAVGAGPSAQQIDDLKAGLRPFRLGAFKVAVDTGARVVPVALQGTRRVLRGAHVVPRPGRVRLWVGAPISPEGEGWRAVVALRDRVADAVAAQCGEPRLDLVAAVPARS